MKIAFGCDHGGYPYHEAVIEFLKSKGYDYDFLGTYTEDSCDYPDFAHPVCEKVASGEADLGILICGTGIGMSMVANKIKGIRCAHVNDAFSAEMTRKHNNANVIALGGRIASQEEVISYIEIFLKTEFDGGRHAIRVNKITEIENKFFK